MGNNAGKYYVGLDMGTESVGWAVTDENYALLRAKGKDMWGARLFPSAQTAADRRSYRVSRRRRQREVARINYLKMCFADAIQKIDSGFMLRLDESKYFYEDRSEENKQSFSVFNDKEFTDREYFKKYPTIYHLRSELLKKDPIVPHDVRLVYLALLNMFKHRGNFLNNSLSIDSKGANISEAYKTLVDVASYFDIAFPNEVSTEELQNILSSQNLSKREKLEKLSNLFEFSKKTNPEAYEILQLCCGMKGKLRNIFGELIEEDNKNFSLSFSDSNYEEEATEAIELVGDDYFEIVAAAKEIYDIGLLANIMKGETYISDARVADYDAHHKDLIILKQVFKEYDIQSYDDFFRKMEEGNYSAYIGSVNSKYEKTRRNGNKGRSQEDVYKTIKNIIKKFPAEADKDQRVAYILDRIEKGIFMPKQLTGSNGVIPNQVHAREMKQILDNASTYLPFLCEKDESGFTTSERILKMFMFNIPYYVGPLGQEYLDQPGYNVWAKRIANGPIYPWNINEKIDVNEAAEKFIVRMLRNCTYLHDQKALPKQSLLYEKFTVLNELNNLRVYGNKISVEEKQDIFNDLFMRGKKVTRKTLCKYLVGKGIISKDDSEDEIISGIDGDFKNYLSSMNKFEPIFGRENIYGSNREMIEKIIFWGTVFGDDRKVLEEKITEAYGDSLDANVIKRISGFKFSGWGNLSREFLEMPGKSGSSEADKSIIILLWETNNNLMELLSSSYSFKEALESKNLKKQKELLEWNEDDLSELYLSPSVKRMVWQTIKILKEIYQVTHKEPEKIFVEMPREDSEKGKRTESRKKKLESLYKGQKEFLDAIGKYDEHDFRQKKLYLYYLQNGKSMYTGNEIDLENLLSNNSRYDIDHIYPRHYIKDDSLDNNLVLVEKEINNDIKGGDYPLDSSIQARMAPMWKGLLRKGFISKEKYDRLLRTTEFTEQEQADFIARQLVETRQGTKAITQILKEVFPSTKVVFSKANVVSSFRQKYDIPKVRCMNSCHHAHDAYLNIVVGNTYYVKFTANPLNFIKEAGKKWKDPSYHYHMDKIFNYRVERNGEVAWVPQVGDDSGTIKKVRATMSKASVLLTAKAYMVHGGISNKATIYSAKEAQSNPNAYYPTKTSDSRLKDVSKYGGITSIANTAYALVQYSVKENKKIRQLVGVPIYLGDCNKDSALLAEYLHEKVKEDNSKTEIKDFSIRLYPIRFNSTISVDGFTYLVGGATGNYIYLKDFVPLYLSKWATAYLKKVDKACNISDFDEIAEGSKVITSENNKKLYLELTDKLGNTIYKNKKSSIFTVVNEGISIFDKLSIEQQCNVIMQIVLWVNSAVQSANLIDLKEVGGVAHAGVLRIKNAISDYEKVFLVERSTLGLYERKVDLLKV
ncbi:CRISPR-associated endonuclease Csn1 [Butyrivibrio hungatei DSM 14810]|uniref:CRISPR-associated endonuclease Cas9 n=1 Tax=Butyrivibrio hungatei DSM 14810 TaxID=1121132 RepID=A0A1M7S3P9_9FIRM|nr:type II CRISPR RNA-guided endonuclease Cas9 [Butyrivibrio hungatei]SHN52975.1 CRISPR-associated endonuclease Csn1 [Butyrivibrio hungatei DSM 14810]